MIASEPSAGRGGPTRGSTASSRAGRVPSGANFDLSEVDADIDVEAVGLVAQDDARSRGTIYRPTGHRPTVGVHLMHPRTDQSQNYNILPLVRAGCMVLGRAGRWVNNDIATEHERLALDVAAGVATLRARGCETVVLLGNSGGGTLAAFYQSQAAVAASDRLTHTAAGDPLTLAEADLPPADALVLIGAHSGEGHALGKWIDPSVLAEDDPFGVDPSLDMYDEVNGFRTPPQPSRYDPTFLTRYQAAQRERVARLDAIARERVRRRRDWASAAVGSSGGERMRLERKAAVVHRMMVYRTMADPAFTDLSIEPDDRVVSAYNNHPRPDLVNYGMGVAGVLTPEAWLSTWSALSTHAKTTECLSAVMVPTLVVHYAGDVITRLSEASSFVSSSAAADKSMVTVRRADHYGFTINPDGSRSGRTAEGTAAVVNWLGDRFGTAESRPAAV